MAGRSLSEPRLLLPFILITLIWSSTWIVIKDQLGSGPEAVPGPWSVTYRFALAAAAMFVLAGVQRQPLRIGREGHVIAALIGVPQFVLNFNFVYAAEQYVTSGIVAVVFALLVVPNALLTRIVFGEQLGGRFVIGSAVAMLGVLLLFLAELRVTTASSGQVVAGIGFTLLGVLSASVANVAQAAERVRRRPIASLLAWAMAYGALFNMAVALALHGAPVVEPRVGYWVGLVYLGLIASALAFALYFRILRAIGPARAAYSSVLVPIVAMLLSTLFEGYRWTGLAAAGGVLALAGLVVALAARRPTAPAETTA
jgi:drug/metabolite transporter (DMT)-like permease